MYAGSVEDKSPEAILEYQAMNLRQFQDFYMTWARKTFPNADEQSVLNHLKSEVNVELFVGCADDELADCALLLLHMAHLRGVSLDALIKAKAQVNFNRQWATKPNAEGFFPHVQSHS